MADMNITAARANLTPTIWDRRFFTEYVRKNRFSKYMGEEMGSLIQVREQLGRQEGDSIVFPSVRRLVGAGVTGNTVLEGNEELLNARSMKLTVSAIRHAVAVSDWDVQKSAIDLRDAAKDALQVWSLEKMRDDLISALGSITANASVSVAYSAASAGQKNAWLAANSDRVLFGSSKANAVSNVMATALLLVDATNDKLTAANISLAKRIALTANPRIRPITVNNDEEWFVLFCNSYQMRDLKADTTIQSSLQYAAERGRDNPLFTGGDLIYDGVIIREIPEIGVISGVGTAGIDVGQAFLCGAQALGIAWAQRTKTTTNVRDYDYMHGVGIQEMRGIGKLRFGTDASTEDSTPKDAGIVTLFTSSVADA
jgi:N4-gp56 family major capsid protein